jgi:1-phosphatidylinositol-4-phosphate 5-kinase
MYVVRNDVEFLKSLNIMDYSMLLLIETKGERKIDQGQHVYVGKDIYHIAIIDYLQLWNVAKMSERFYKEKIKKCDGAMLSAIKPEEYSERFLAFMNQHLFK